MTIYELITVAPDQHPEEIGKYDQNMSDGSIKSDSTRVGYFSSVEKAEYAIRTLIEQRKQDIDRHPDWFLPYVCFYVTEHILDDKPDKQGNYGCFESIRTYDAEGNLHCFSDYDDRCVKKFVGCDDSVNGVQEGDFAWVITTHTIYPILWDKSALSIEWCKAKGVFGDYTDNSGLAFTVDNGHEHPPIESVFPLSSLPQAELTQEMKLKMLDIRAKYYKGEAL